MGIHSHNQNKITKPNNDLGTLIKLLVLTKMIYILISSLLFEK